MYEFKLPDLGEGIQEGELLQWHVNEKDVIREDDPLCDMETDKAAVTIPSPKTGVIHKLGARPGDMVQVGQVLVIIETDASRKTDDRPPDPESSGTTDQEGREKKEKKQDTLDLHTPNAGSEAKGPGFRAIAAPAVRRLAREMAVDINQVSGTGPGGRVTADDLVQYEKQVDGSSDDRAQARGASDETAVLKEQADPGTDDANEPLPVSGIPFLNPTPLPDFAAKGPVEIIPIRSLRRKTAAKTVTSSILVPHVAHMDEVDVTELEKWRHDFNDNLGRHPIPAGTAHKQEKPEHQGEAEHQAGSGTGGKLTLMAFVIKAAASLLKEYPAFNASVDTEQMQIIHKKFYHIGFAADTPKGLMVPVIQDADRHNLAAVGYRIKYLARAAREGKIGVEDLTGGTFSVTNVGAIGGTHVLPIINYPESAILGMGRVEKKPVVKDDVVVIRQMLPLTLCFDHRVTDGARAARFVRDLKAMLEDPMVFMTHI
jgi:pyruvate dehydrogenase E2 component (dihydrolipoamide acetyltransferase)